MFVVSKCGFGTDFSETEAKAIILILLNERFLYFVVYAYDRSSRHGSDTLIGALTVNVTWKLLIAYILCSFIRYRSDFYF